MDDDIYIYIYFDRFKKNQNMENLCCQYVSLSSRDGISTPIPGVLRYEIDSALRNLTYVEWCSFETSQKDDDGFTIDSTCNKLYFSEGMRFFKAILPCGSYTNDNITTALESALTCAIKVAGEANNTTDTHRPHNKYHVKVLESGRLCVSSNGTVPFTVHIFKGVLNIQKLVRNGRWQAQIYFSCPEEDTEPISRGNMLEIFRPSKPPILVQVIHGTENILLVQFYTEEDFRDDVEFSGWTLSPVGNDTTLPELLGLGEKDLNSTKSIQVVHSSSPFSSCPSDVAVNPKTTMHLGVASPHGCVEKDSITLDGFGGFLNGQRADVARIISEQQLIVSIDTSRLVDFCPNGPLRFSHRNKDYVIHVKTVMKAEISVNEVSVCMQITSSNCIERLAVDADKKWISIRLFGPVPCVDWLQAGRQIGLKIDGNRVYLRCQFAHPSLHDACIKRNAVVGTKKVDRSRNNVLLMRLAVGRTEARGVVALKQKNNLHAFGRAQMCQNGGLLDANALVGTSYFTPPLEKVEFMEVCFMTPQGRVVLPGILGEYSLLLRCMVSS